LAFARASSGTSAKKPRSSSSSCLPFDDMRRPPLPP
jgi:hypothetical protein